MFQFLRTFFADTVQVPSNVPQVDITDATVTNVFNVILGLAGAVAVAFIVWGGIQYTLSQGDTGKIKQAKDTILYAIVGLVIVIFAFSIVNFVIGKF